MQKRNVLNSPRLLELKKHRHRAILNKVLLSLLGFSAIFILLAYLSRLNNLNINEVEILGNKIVDTEAIKGAVEEQIAGKYLWLFPKTNILFYPKNAIKNKLQDKFKRLENIDLSIKDKKTLEVSVSERTALYTWCGAEVPGVGILSDVGRPETGRPTSGTEQCYFLDADGYIFDEAPYFSGNVYFKFYGPAGLGSYFSKQNFKQLISFRDVLLNMGLKPVALYTTSDGDIQIFLSGGTSSTTDPKIILKADADFQNVAENLQAALATEPLQSKFKKNYSSLQYIDLRFGNKVYDKFQ